MRILLIVICLFWFICEFNSIKAETDSFVPIADLAPQDGPEFHASKNGLNLSAGFSKSVKDLSLLEVKIQLSNTTSSKISFFSSTGLDGFGLSMTDSFEQKVAITDALKRDREGGLAACRT